MPPSKLYSFLMLEISNSKSTADGFRGNYILSNTQSVTYTKCVAYTVTMAHKLDIHAMKCPCS